MHERDIFLSALEKPSAGERADYLARVCGQDVGLRSRVEALLRSAEVEDSFLERPILGQRPGLSPANFPNPHLTDVIGGVFPALDKLDAMAEDNALAASPAVKQLGDYRIIREAGRGGMGIVYEAEQVSLGRHVALKVLPKQLLPDSKRKQRFVREAKAAARLHHTNIVPVFGVGEQDGMHYYVMQFIHGRGLDDVLLELQALREQSETAREPDLTGSRKSCRAAREISAVEVAQSLVSGRFQQTPSADSSSAADVQEAPSTQSLFETRAWAVDPRPTDSDRDTAQPRADSGEFTLSKQSEIHSPVRSRHAYWRSVARIGLQAAEALHYAHAQGVVHRDVKPANLLLDRQGCLWITDFGLAKSADEQDLTRTGDVLGTLRYMSLEQFEGKGDGRSDVYALGLTLYELLCLKPAFAEADGYKLVKHVTTGTPARLRTLNRHIPRDLETIVHKAIDRDPAQRYQTAGELANDLARYLHDEPIQARRISPVQRFARWCRRNPAIATLTTTIAVLLLTAAVVSGIAAVMFEGLRDEAQVAAENERTHRIQADEARDAALRAELLARRNLYAAHMNLARDAWENSDVPRVLDLLERHIPAPGEPDWRSFEWYYLLGLCNQDQLTIDCGQSSLTPAFSPDGSTLAVGINGRQIELWNLAKREITRIITDPTCFGPVAFSPDGMTLASAGGGKLKLWDVATGEQLRSMDAYQHTMQQLAFTPDGIKLISTDGGNLSSVHIPGIIRVWEVATGDLLQELHGHSNWIASMAVSPDGTCVMATGEGEVRFWDLGTGRPLEMPGVKCSHNGGVSWSRDGRLIATKLSPHTVIWDAKTGEERGRLLNSYSTAFSPDGTKLATAHFDSTVRLWDVATGRELSVFKGHSQWVFQVAFSPDGRHLASVGRDCQCKVWPIEDLNRAQISTPSTDRRLELSRADLTGRDRIQLSPDGDLLAVVQNDSSVAIIDARTETTRSILKVGSIIRALAFSSDGNRLAVAHQSGVQLWDVPAGTLLGRFDSEVEVWTVDLSPDGRLLAAGTDDRQVEVYRVDPLEKLTVLPWNYSTPPGCLAFSPDSRQLGVCTAGKPIEVQLWTVSDWTMQCSLEPSTVRLSDGVRATCLKFSPDGAVVALSRGAVYRPREGAATTLFDAATGGELGILQGDDTYHTAHAFSRDGDTLVTGTDQGKITFWDLNTLEERSTFQWDGQQIASLALSPDGQTLFSGNSRAQVRIWRGPSHERIERTERVGLFRRAGEYAADGRWEEADRLYTHLIERGDSLNVRLHRARTYAELGRWQEAINDFREVAESDGGGYRPWYELALAQLASGDEPAYRDTCAKLLDRFRGTRDPLTADFIAWTHSLRPQTGVDWGEILALASRPFATGDAGAAPRKTLAAVLLRAGLYEDAIAELEAAGQDVQREENRTSAAYQAYLLAIAQARLGNRETARTALDAAALQSENDSPSWFREATIRLLREEAFSVLQDPADPSLNSQPALDIYSRAIEVSGEVPLLWRLRARSHERLGQSMAAADDLARAFELEQEFEFRRLTRLATLATGDRLSQGWTEFVYERARYRFETLADYDGALEDCLFALNFPSSPYLETLDLYLRVHDARGTLDDADAEWLRRFSRGQLPKFYSARADYYQECEQHDKAASDRARLEWNRELEARRDAWVRHQDAARPDPWKHLLQARDHLILQNTELAEAELAEAADVAPDDPDYWIARAGLVELYGDGRTPEAEWKHIVGLADGDPLPWVRRGEWYARRGEYDQAGADFSVAASLAVRERRTESPRDATDQPALDDGPVTPERFDELTRDDPENRERWFADARWLIRQGRYAEALERYVVAINQDRLNHELLEYAALLLLNQQTQTYRDLCQQIALRTPPQSDDQAREDYYRAGILVLGTDNGLAPESTLQAVEQAAGRDSDATILIWQAVAHLRHGDSAQAAERLNSAITSHRPELDQLAPALALANARLGRNDDARLWRDAVEYLRHELASGPDQLAPGDLHDWLRFCLWGREVELEFDPETAVPATLAEYVQAIEACIRRGELDRAATWSLLALERFPVIPADEERFGHRLYSALAENDKLRSAVIAAASEPDPIWKGLALHYSLKAHWTDAAQCYQHVKTDLGGHARSFAIVLTLAGDADGYRKHCLAMIERVGPVSPGSSALQMVELCVAGPDSGIDPDEVLAWLEQTRETSADQPWIQVIAPMSYYRAGQFEKAISEIPVDRPEHGVHPFVRACAHWQLGNAAQARTAFNEGVDHYAHPVRAARSGYATWSHMHWLNASLWYREAALLLGEDPLKMLSDEAPPPIESERAKAVTN